MQAHSRQVRWRLHLTWHLMKTSKRTGSGSLPTSARTRWARHQLTVVSQRQRPTSWQPMTVRWASPLNSTTTLPSTMTTRAQALTIKAPQSTLWTSSQTMEQGWKAQQAWPLLHLKSSIISVQQPCTRSSWWNSLHLKPNRDNNQQIWSSKITIMMIIIKITMFTGLKSNNQLVMKVKKVMRRIVMKIGRMLMFLRKSWPGRNVQRRRESLTRLPTLVH